MLHNCDVHCRNEIAYSSSDKMVYIRKFSPCGIEMVLLSTLQGHYNEVTCIKWNNIMKKWITGSEDGTIRIWVSIVSIYSTNRSSRDTLITSSDKRKFSVLLIRGHFLC